MIPPKDEDIEALLGERIIKPIKIKCSSGNIVERFCCNKSCQFDALCCSVQSCQFCQNRHSKCILSQMKRITKRLQERLFLQTKFLRSIIEIENEIINKIFTSRRELIKNMSFWKLEEDLSQVIESIYCKERGINIKGKQMKRLFTQMALFEETGIIQNLKIFKQESQNIMGKFILNRKQFLANLFKIKEKEQNLIKYQISKINSKILTDKKEDFQKFQFLLKELKNPTQLILLFRASDNDFKAAKFHEYCDNIHNTVTVIRTQFNKTIAGFTPLKWNSLPEEYVMDRSKSSFLLQLDQKKKMSITNPTFAIYNSKSHGPIFGEGHDIWISDLCNKGKSGSKFPCSYNNGNFEKNQYSLQFFCGVKSGNNFSILEYQVFKVIK